METLLNLSEDDTMGMYIRRCGNDIVLKVHNFGKSVDVYLTKEQSCELRELLAKVETECKNAEL